jgi:hypothetical protein
VKEKFEAKDHSHPSLITVMEKQADAGDVDDWRFTMIRLADRAVVRDGFKISCAQCHSRYAESGFVSPTTDVLVKAFSERAWLSYVLLGCIAATSLVVLKVLNRLRSRSLDGSRAHRDAKQSDEHPPLA